MIYSLVTAVKEPHLRSVFFLLKHLIRWTCESHFFVKIGKIKTEYQPASEKGLEAMEARWESCTIPVWRSGPDSLRSFLDQLDTSKELNLFASDAELIYTSLNKSGKPDLYQQLSKEEKTDVTAFAKYLEANYGRSLNEKKRRFQVLTQDPDEDENAWFQRVIREYFATKGTKRPGNAQFSSENKSEISLAFIAGLRRTDLKRVMKLRMDETEDSDTEFFKLGRICQRKALSLRELEGQVYTVETAEREQVFQINDFNDETQDNFDIITDTLTELKEEIALLQQRW